MKSDVKYWNLYRCTFDRLSNADRFVFAYIEQFSRNGKICEASQDHIAKRMCIGVATVKRCMKRLEEKKLIKVIRTAPKKADTWRRDRNKCIVDRGQLEHINSVWKKKRQKDEDRLPDVLRVNAEWLQCLGASTKCILFANMYQLKQAGEKFKETDYRAQYIMYSQRDLAMQCGCKITALKDALEELTKDGIIEQYNSNSNWSKSRKYYVLNDSVIVGDDTSDTAGNDTSEELETKQSNEFSTSQPCNSDATAGNDTSEQPEMILATAGSDTSIQSEMIPNEFIDESIMNTSMNTDENKFSSPIARCDVVLSASDRPQPKLTGKERMQRSVDDLVNMSDEELESRLAKLNNRKDGEQ